MKDWSMVSSLAPPTQPFTFREVGSTEDVCSSLVGEIVFKKFMGREANALDDSAVIPLQLRNIIMQQLLFYHEMLKGKHPEEKQKARDLFDAAAQRCGSQGNPY